MNDPTERQLRVLRAIAEYIDRTDCSPTHRELCAALAVKSTNAIAHHAQALERKGCLERDRRGLARRLRLTEQGERWLRKCKAPGEGAHPKTGEDWL